MQNFTGKDNSHKESVQKAKGFLLYCKAQNKTCSCFSAPFLVIGTPREDGRGGVFISTWADAYSPLSVF